MPKVNKDMNIVLTGDKELLNLLSKLPARIEKKITRNAIKKQVQILAKDMKTHLPRRVRNGIPTGRYRKSITWKVKTYKASGISVGFAGPAGGEKRILGEAYGKREGTKAPGNLPWMLEYGTRRSRGYPHVRPAWDANKSRMKTNMAREIGRGIEREAAKLKGKKT